MDNCSLCEKIKKIKQNQYPYLIAEWDECYWLLGEHQYFEGYTLLLAKEHQKEMTGLNSDQQNKVFQSLMRAHKIIEKVYSPNKINLCSLGNVDPHVHWHIFPRYANDPFKNEPVWLRMKEFSSKNISVEQAQIIIKKLQLAC